MPEAWMIRSGQQQRLVESLVKKYHSRLDQLVETIRTTDPEEFEREVKYQRDWFTNELLTMMLKPHGVLHLRNPWIETPVVYSFLAQIRTDISRFARAPEETAVLLHRFFLEVVKIGCAECEVALGGLEISDPQKIFHAPSAMTEIEIPEDDI